MTDEDREELEAAFKWAEKRGDANNLHPLLRPIYECGCREGVLRVLNTRTIVLENRRGSRITILVMDDRVSLRCDLAKIPPEVLPNVFHTLAGL